MSFWAQLQQYRAYHNWALGPSSTCISSYAAFRGGENRDGCWVCWTQRLVSSTGADFSPCPLFGRWDSRRCHARYRATTAVARRMPPVRPDLLNSGRRVR